MQRELANFQLLYNTRRNLYSKTIRYSYTNHRNLKHRLGHNRLDTIISDSTDIPIQSTPIISTKFYPAKNIPCRREDCGCCQQLKGSQQANSFQTNFIVKIPTILSCDSTCAIYLLECKYCFKQYIGETGSSIRARMRRHRNISGHGVKLPIGLCTVI